tara:strand:- start:747 stop:1079 length:333 start_codon:yes stop_codon:yes gene_type:complete
MPCPWPSSKIQDLPADCGSHPPQTRPRSIGTIIALNQLNFALGLNPDAIPDWKSHAHFYERVYESLSHADHTKVWNPVIFLINMAGLVYLVKFAPPKVPLPAIQRRVQPR